MRFQNSIDKWKPRKMIKYKGRLWNVKDLLIYLAKKVEELSSHQCKPRARCLFKYQDYMDKKHINIDSLD